MKIFCIGLHKTGTLSLSRALEELGYKTRHGYKKQSDMILDALYDGVEPLKYLEGEYGEHDAYLDLYAVRDHYALLEEAYPDAKFILTVRKEDEWVESVKRQIKKRPDSPFFHHWYYETEYQWRHFHRGHVLAAKQHFKFRHWHQMATGRVGNFLAMSITEGDGWRPLCRFLDKPVPKQPFPHANKSTEI